MCFAPTDTFFGRNCRASFRENRKKSWLHSVFLLDFGSWFAGRYRKVEVRRSPSFGQDHSNRWGGLALLAGTAFAFTDNSRHFASPRSSIFATLRGRLELIDANKSPLGVHT